MADLKYLERSLKKVAKYANDHDYICKCRPADVRLALNRIKFLKTELENYEQIVATERAWADKFRDHLADVIRDRSGRI